MVGKYCGSVNPPEITSSSNIMSLIFTRYALELDVIKGTVLIISSALPFTICNSTLKTFIWSLLWMMTSFFFCLKRFNSYISNIVFLQQKCASYLCRKITIESNQYLNFLTWIYPTQTWSELGTFEWWISGLRLNPLFFLISRLNNACSPLVINLQIN